LPESPLDLIDQTSLLTMLPVPEVEGVGVVLLPPDISAALVAADSDASLAALSPSGAVFGKGGGGAVTAGDVTVEMLLMTLSSVWGAHSLGAKD
jgi:hypothetical protein